MANDEAAVICRFEFSVVKECVKCEKIRYVELLDIEWRMLARELYR